MIDRELMISRELWRKRMSQAELSRKTGIQQASVSRIVRGLEPAYPKRGQRIADAVGWTQDASKLFEPVDYVDDLDEVGQVVE